MQFTLCLHLNLYELLLEGLDCRFARKLLRNRLSKWINPGTKPASINYSIWSKLQFHKKHSKLMMVAAETHLLCFLFRAVHDLKLITPDARCSDLTVAKSCKKWTTYFFVGNGWANSTCIISVFIIFYELLCIHFFAYQHFSLEETRIISLPKNERKTNENLKTEFKTTCA